MNQQTDILCPYCGTPISIADKFCKNCGRTLLQQTSGPEAQAKPQEVPLPPPEPAYERQYSVVQRFYRVIVSPRKAMRDIGFAPEYGGPVIILFLRIIVSTVVLSIAYSKIKWTGDQNIINQVTSLLSSAITLAVIIGVGLLIAYWLGKALIVKYACDSGSEWTFATAASIVGYAYLPELILAIVSSAIVYPMIPTVTLNVSDLAATERAISDYQSQLLWITIVISIPLGILSLLWKSYVGGLGTKFGTEEKASLALGFAVFLILGLIGWLVSFALTGNV